MKKLKNTWVDFLVLAVIAALIIGAIVKFATLKRHEQEPLVFTYSMLVEDAGQPLADALQTGDAVFDIKGKASIGVISGVELADNGVVLTLTAEGTPIDGGCRVGVYNILPEYSGEFFTKYAIWDGVVTSVR